ncbi:MORN repeat-containing protein 1-like isoform X3 [Clavelina lepadiformis]|uniref:MORN repeat-containing protein 1-like isoform X3 n=1 Tax=Clavelina lepadiformis TaxID=159417 RepID=UPI0040436671
MPGGISSERRNYYVGETVNQLRNGYGVYFYKNKFFRYEGEWLKGKKHGHGKLLMADGSYYEGEFKDGEIEGHGFRKWQHNRNSYSGEFSKGEMQGHGVMNYADGSQYQGEFSRNQRHGTGVMRDSDGNEYEGSWYKNKKHGQGIQTYPNGEEYEGDWVEGCRHGHGELNCVDGSIYEGQWRADKFNGQGTMVHTSGFTYEGLWINGQPETEATEISVKLSPGQKHLEVPQGKRFSLQLLLVDSNNKPVTGERGREFQISAGYRYSQSPRAAQSQSLLELIEDIEAKPVATPFGYDVLPYPIVETVKDVEDIEESNLKKKQRQSPNSSRVFGAAETIHESAEMTADNQQGDSSITENTDDADNSSTLSGSKYATSEIQLELSVEVAGDDADALRLLPPPAPQRSSADGFVEFQDLLLPSAPPNYRPFLLEDEVVPASLSQTSTGSTSSLRRGPGVSSVSSSSVRSDKTKRSKGSRTASAASTSSVSQEGKGGKGKTKLPQEQEEKGAKMGDYVLIVEEITQPSFLGKRLPPAFVVIKITAPRKPPKKTTPKRN